MSKQTIAWHEEGLKNWAAHLVRIREGITRQEEAYQHSFAEFSFECAQVAEAKKRGLAGFDEDKFMKKKVRKP